MVTPYRRRPNGKPVLDDFKKGLIINMVTEGSSQRSAAGAVGCAPSTITRTAQRDRRFGLDLLQAHELLKMRALRTMNRVADQDKNWRAAAWLLERLEPDRFALRKPFQFTLEQMKDIFKQVCKAFSQGVPSENRMAAFRRLTELMQEYRKGQEEIFVDMYFEEDDPQPQPESANEPGAESPEDVEMTIEPTSIAAMRAAAQRTAAAARQTAEPPVPNAAKAPAADAPAPQPVAKEAEKNAAAPAAQAAPAAKAAPAPKAAASTRPAETPATPEASQGNPFPSSSPAPSAPPTPEAPRSPRPSG
jgi:transposase